MNSEVNLRVRLGTMELETPVLLASGTCGWGTEFEAIEGFRGDLIGAIILKGTTLEPRAGNRNPRIVETAGGAGILNSIGLENPGVEKVVAEYLPKLEDHPAKVIANCAGSTAEEYAGVVRRFDEHERIDALEINVSCPNIERGGLQFGADPAACANVVRLCRTATRKPLIVKLTPNVTDIATVAAAAVDEGADALTVANTVLGTALDIRTRRPILGNVSGGLSGPAVKPIALQKVLEVTRFLRTKKLDVPVIASGGIMTAEDALEFMMMGARAFALGTALFVDFRTPRRIVEGLKELLAELGETDINDIVGTVELP